MNPKNPDHIEELVRERTAQLEATNADLLEKIAERKRVEEELVRLASFPEKNPNPIMEIGYSGNIVYLNPKSRELFPDLASYRLKHPLLSGLEQFIQKFKSGDLESPFTQEVKVGETYFHQVVVNIPESETIRLYHTDITERKQNEEKIRAANNELMRFNNAMVGRELRMIELKKEVNELCGGAGQPPRYPLDFEKEKL